MGIGDMVIFLPFIEAISKKFNSPITLLTKESSRAKEYLSNNKYIEKIIDLKRNNNDDYHGGLFGFFRLRKDLKKFRFDKAFIFNSSLRYNLVCKSAGVKEIYQYPLFKKDKQHIIDAAKNLLRKINLNVESNPQISIDENLIKNAKEKFNINEKKINILFGVGGSGPTKRTPAHILIEFMKLSLKNYDCKFFLATGKNKEEQKILNDIIFMFKENCIPLDNFSISETLPIIKNCKIAICNDTSFSHLSAALGVPTIVLMCDSPLLYGNYSSKMYPIIPDGMETVSHNSRGKEKINPIKIFNKFKTIIK
tara:strand:- start:1064 stop:1990 length:927 start_codon:yes stop_codon:yes gene_type:complete